MQRDTLDDLVIREMRYEDVPRIHAIHTECLNRTLIDHYTREALDAWMAGRSPDGYWQAAQKQHSFLVAETPDRVVGYANWFGDELLSLFVEPDYQRRGVGSALFEACSACADLSYIKATLGAVPFYERYGFVRGERSFDLKRGVELPHIVMRRAISRPAKLGGGSLRGSDCPRA